MNRPVTKGEIVMLFIGIAIGLVFVPYCNFVFWLAR